MPVVTSKLLDRFWSKVDIKEDKEVCWEWQAFSNKGYGAFRGKSGVYYAHRVAYFLHYGIDPLDKQVCHKCEKSRKCCNPNHLFLGTNEENQQDAFEKTGKAFGKSGESNYVSKLTEAQVLSIIEECATTSTTYKNMGEKYGVSPVTIFCIINGDNWSYIKGKKFKKDRFADVVL